MIGIVRVDDDDELLMMTARGKIQRIAVSDISVIGRNTQGVRIMTLDEGDTLAAVVRVPKEEAARPWRLKFLRPRPLRRLRGRKRPRNERRRGANAE